MQFVMHRRDQISCSVPAQLPSSPPQSRLEQTTQFQGMAGASQLACSTSAVQQPPPLPVSRPSVAVSNRCVAAVFMSPTLGSQDYVMQLNTEADLPPLPVPNQAQSKRRASHQLSVSSADLTAVLPFPVSRAARLSRSVVAAAAMTKSIINNYPKLMHYPPPLPSLPLRVSLQAWEPSD